MMEIASDGFPVCKIITIKTEVKGQTGKGHTEPNCSEHTGTAGGAGGRIKFHFYELSDEQRLSENCIYGG